MKKNENKSGLSESFIAGVIAIVFLIVGYQTALFVHRAAVMKVVANRDEPDTVFVYRSDVSDYDGAYVKGGAGTDGNEARNSGNGTKMSISEKEGEAVAVVRKNADHHPRAETVRSNAPRKKVETFRFDPNTISVEDLCRLGFTPKQAQSIDNYRQKGGRFRRKTDFAKSFVVSDSIYRRLELYIDIPLTDLNLADSAALDALPGIGGWYASKIIEHRNALGGYSYKEQLMDIQRFDEQKFKALEDLIIVSPEYQTPYPLWSLPADSLCLHPYIGNIETARAIVLYRNNSPKDRCTIEELRLAGILTPDNADKLSKCLISKP